MAGYSNATRTLTTADTQVEAVAAILDWDDRVDLASTAALQGIRCPASGSILDFGVVITEALTNAHATHIVIALRHVPLEGGAAVTVASLTLPNAAADVTVANIRPATATAAQAVAVGARFRSNDVDLPFKVAQGGHFYVEVLTAAGAAGGAFKAFVVLREDGIAAATAASPMTTLTV